jgi:glutamyl-Q tRNA(Asp) synthetase
MTNNAVSTSFITRFAPSPTGRLHLGHAFSALIAHDAARQAGGLFRLRIEDIDQGRCRPAFVDGIFEDLRWLGLDWDGEVMIQSARGAAHARALERLRRLDLLYVCTCTRAEIAASAPHGPMGAAYPGTCRTLGRKPLPGIAHCWRLDMARATALAGPLVWHDEGNGPIVADPMAQGDIVIARKDAAPAYHLAVVVDDAAQGVTHVTRGRDLFEATHVQRLLHALLDLPVPRYAHHPLVIGGDGTRLAKRKQSPTLESLRQGGMDGRDLAEMLREARFPVGFALEAA